MSQTLNINNFGPTNLVQQTRLSAVTPASSATLGVLNNAGISANDFIAVGTLGSDTTELLTVQSITGENTITPTAHSTLDHAAYDYVNKLFGNKIKVYRAPNVNGLQPDDTDFASIATIDIQIDRAYTQYTDATGDNTFWYKFTYFNSTLSSETNLADSKSVRGGSTGDYCSIYDIREEAGFKNAPYVTDPMIDAKRQAAQDEINGTLHGFYTVPFTAPINPFISDICRRLAAGLLLIEQYSAISATSTANGTAKVTAARADLQALAMKEKVLVDTTGASMAQPGSTGGVSSWPDATTDATSGGTVVPTVLGEGQDGGHVFRRRDMLGYTTRKY